MTNQDNLERLWESRGQERELERRSIERRWRAKHGEFNATRRDRGLGEVEFAVFREFAEFNSGRHLNGFGEIEFDAWGKAGAEEPSPVTRKTATVGTEITACCVCGEAVGDGDFTGECPDRGNVTCDYCVVDDDYSCSICEAGEPEPAAVKVASARSALRHVRLGIGLDEALRAESSRTGAPASEIIRRALASYLG